MRKLSWLLFKAERIEIKLHKTISIVEANKRFPWVNSFLVFPILFLSQCRRKYLRELEQKEKILKRFGIQMIRNQSFLKSFCLNFLGGSNWIPTSLLGRSRISAYAAVSLFLSFIKLRVVRESEINFPLFGYRAREKLW